MKILKNILILLTYFFLLCVFTTLMMNYEGINLYVYIPSLVGFFVMMSLIGKKLFSYDEW